MYEKGIIRLTTPRCAVAVDDDDDYCQQYDELWNEHKHSIQDARGSQCGPNTAYLPHSCQEWVIGGKEEIIAMIEDLTELLKHL